jgi:hypothetical protein
MATFTKFQSFVEKVAEKVHNLGSDSLKVMLTLTAPSASASNVKADLTEITAGNGYTAGGTAASITSSAQTSGTYKLVLGDVVFTATGAVGPFRYVVLYNDTATNKDLIGFYDYGSSLSLASGDTFTVDFDPSTGVLTIA